MTLKNSLALFSMSRDFLTYIAILTPSKKNRHFWKKKSDLQSIKSMFQSKSRGGFTLFMQFHPLLRCGQRGNNG
jgi:hypothetical protein